MKEAEIQCLWVTEWAIIEEMSFLCNKHRCWWSLLKQFYQVCVTYLLHVHVYYYFYLKYYADLNWLCSVGTCIVDVLILD